MNTYTEIAVIAVAFLVGLPIVLNCVLGIRYIPSNKVGHVIKLWSKKGSVGDGSIIAFNGEAGYQGEILRGGLHFWKPFWQYKVHKEQLVVIPEGKMGYVYARDGKSLEPSQTLGRVVECNHFQDVKAFITNGGQRGRQREILREGVYAINLAMFIVLTEEHVYYLDMDDTSAEQIESWQKGLKEIDGFEPIVIGGNDDNIGVITVHEGPSLGSSEIIAPEVGAAPGSPDYHNNFQDPEAFLRAGGKRGRQYATLLDGTYFINRWFATVEMIPKTVIPIGHVGVVISYCGKTGHDISGTAFRHGERVEMGEKGVWQTALGPGKYAFNTFSGNMVLTPTTNFVLHWITGRTEGHKYDETLKSIDLITLDAYEPNLPLSVVVHIDYQKAPGVIQRFGDVKKLITQTLDPMLSAYFRDVAHKKTMIQLLQQRDEIQAEAREALKTKFREFDIECVDVLIGKPDTVDGTGVSKIETLLEQLRLRQLSLEQIETYERQQSAAEKLKSLRHAEAIATMQTELTNSKVQIEIASNEGDARLVTAEKEAAQIVVKAKAEKEQKELDGLGESSRILAVGKSEADVLLQKVAAYKEPKLYALNLALNSMAKSSQPLVPQRVFMTGGGNDGKNLNMLDTVLGLFLASKSEILDATDGVNDCKKEKGN